jgi:hypothetical protein
VTYKWSVISVIALCLSGCAASGKPYSGLAQSSVASPTSGRLTVFRTAETKIAAGRDTLIAVDSTATKYVGYGGYVSFDIGAGDHIINASMPGDKTQCTLQLSLGPRDELFFEVKPLTERIMTEAFSAGLTAGLLTKGIYVGDTRAPGSIKPCEGYFSITAVERDYALNKLVTIRESSQ